mgnify:CR=1 FL=1
MDQSYCWQLKQRKGVKNKVKWIQTNDLAYTHEFELEGDESTTIKIIGDIEKAKRKLRLLFGSKVEIVTFIDMD